MEYTPDSFYVVMNAVVDAVILVGIFGWIVPLIIGIRRRSADKSRGRTLIICAGIWGLLIILYLSFQANFR
jgi:hypothetical protein